MEPRIEHGWNTDGLANEINHKGHKEHKEKRGDRTQKSETFWLLSPDYYLLASPIFVLLVSFVVNNLIS